MITIVKYYAFAHLHVKVFQRGETMERIHIELHQICPTYVACEILQGEMQNVPLDQLTKQTKPQ